MKRNEWLFVIGLFILSSLLMFLNLGDRFLAGDELHTAGVSKSIVQYGKPTIVDGDRIYSGAANLEYAFNEDYLKKFGEMNIQFYPHLHFYVVALGFKLFGLNSFGGRIFPALFGLFTLPLLYFTALKINGSRRKSSIITFLLAVCIPFYLYSRQARYYSLAMFFSLLVLFSYIKIMNKEKNSSILFIVSSIILFHTHYIPFAVMMISIALHSLIRGNFLEIVKKGLIISVFTLPWFFFYNPFMKDASLLVVPFRSFIWFLVSFVKPAIYILLYIFPLVLVPLLFKIKRNSRINLILIIIALVPFIEIIMAKEGGGLRHYVFLFPLLMILLGEVFYYILKKNKKICFILMLLFIFTNLFFVAPFLPVKWLLQGSLEKDSDAYYFVKDNFRVRILVMDYTYELTHSYESPEEMIVDAINKKGYSKNDVFLTNTGSGLLLFYTDMINYRESLNRTPEWIIPRKPYSLWGNDEKYDYIISKITDSYEKITIDSIDSIWIYDEPHPRSRRFKQTFLPDSRYDTYPIEIYHLKK